MAVSINVTGTYTPQCGECGIALCWDLSEEEYLEHKAFWDGWECCKCKPDYLRSFKKLHPIHDRKEDCGNVND